LARPDGVAEGLPGTIAHEWLGVGGFGEVCEEFYRADVEEREFEDEAEVEGCGGLEEEGG